MSFVISGDCGGTNTRLSLWEIPDCDACPWQSAPTGVPGRIVYAKKYHNEVFKCIVDICKTFLQEAECPTLPKVCVLACAGPIVDNTVSFTNITDGWVIDGAELKEQLNIPTLKLINDFAAMGYGLLTLRPEEYVTLNDVPRDPTAPVATIGAGTGLGECFLTPSGNGAYECYACEGGHADFAPTNELEVELLNYLKEKFHEKHRISMERIISGIGLSNVYEFLSQKYSFKVNKAIHTEWEEAGSLKGAVVGKYATSDELCRQAMEIFVRAYGREAGNAALKYLPRGGFYITGGLACKNLSFFTESPEFIESFFDKGRVSAALKHIPFYLVLTEELGERGAHFAAYQLLTQQQQSKSPLMTDRTRLYAATATAAAAFVAVSAAKLLSRR